MPDTILGQPIDRIDGKAEGDRRRALCRRPARRAAGASA